MLTRLRHVAGIRIIRISEKNAAAASPTAIGLRKKLLDYLLSCRHSLAPESHYPSLYADKVRRSAGQKPLVRPFAKNDQPQFEHHGCAWIPKLSHTVASTDFPRSLDMMVQLRRVGRGRKVETNDAAASPTEVSLRCTRVTETEVALQRSTPEWISLQTPHIAVRSMLPSSLGF